MIGRMEHGHVVVAAAGPPVTLSSAVGLELAPPGSSAAVAACWTHPGGALVPSFVVGEVNLRLLTDY